MSNFEVSEQNTAFLLSQEGELTFEFFGHNDKGPPQFAVSITRALNAPGMFLLAAVRDVKVKSPDDVTWNALPVVDFIDLLDLAGRFTVTGTTHLGPISADDAFSILEILHLKFALIAAQENLDAAVGKFNERSGARVTPAVARPARAAGSSTVVPFPGRQI